MAILSSLSRNRLFSIANKVALQYDVTGIALGGFPSYLTSEFLVKELEQNGCLKEPLHLFGIVDYDPNGYWIATEFAKQFQDFGIKIGSVHSLVNPQDLPGDLVELCKYKIDHSQKTKHWLEATNGIGGKAYGLEADALGGQRLRLTYEAAIKPYLKPGTKKGHGKQKSVAADEKSSLQSVEEIMAAIAHLSGDDLGKLSKLLLKKWGF